MAPESPDDPELASCKSKLKIFRLKELKDVLHQLGLPKQGKKQELLDRLTSVLCDPQDQEFVHTKNNGATRETLVKIVEDTFRKMQGPTHTVASSRSHVDSGHSAKSKKKPDDSPKLAAVCCPCGNSMPSDSMIKCVDPQCNMWQHVSCVIVPEKPADDSAPELPSCFYCEMCRINRADPFQVTINNPLLPILVAPSIIEADGSYTVQYTAKSFALSRANREMLQKAEYDLQVWCILLNDQVPFRMHWPLHSNLEVNGVHIRVVSRQRTQKLGANGRDDGPLVTDYLREGSNKIALSRNDTRTFCLGIRIVKRRTLEQVLNLVPKEQDGEKFDDALARVRRCVGGGAEANNGDSDSDIEVVADSVSLNVRCPMTASRIRVAGRFKPCAHMGCFDLEAFIEINQRSRKWQCPICLKNYSLENIIIDPYFNRITSLVQSCGNEATEIDVKPDGSWRIKGGPELKDLAKWHLPDGTLCVVTDSGAKSKTGIVKHDSKEEALSEDPDCRLKLGIRKNSNGQWQIRKKGLVPSSDGDSTRQLENKSCTAPTITVDDAGTEDGSCSLEPGRNGHPVSHVNNLESPPAGENAPPAPREQDVVVLSDSDDDDAVRVLSPKALEVGGEQSCGGPNDTTYIALKEGFDDLGLSFWDFPSSPLDVPNYEMFDSGTLATSNADEVENHPSNDQSKNEPVSLGDHTQTCHDLHSDKCDESLVTAKTASKKKRKRKSGGVTALDASIGGSTAYDGQHEEGYPDPSSRPHKRGSVQPRFVVIDSDTD